MNTIIYIPCSTTSPTSRIISPIALTPTGASPSTASSTTTATQSICPKGWTLPSQTQIDSLSGGSSNTTYVGSFSPVLGGYYLNGTLGNESTYGFWWGSTAYDSAQRYLLYYDGSSLYTDGGTRRSGFYVRCVQAS